MRIPRIAGLLSAVALSVVMIGCTHSVRYESGSPGQAAGNARHQVAMLEFHFQPESLNVFTGDTVTWVNKGNLPHTTTSGVDGKPDGLWDTKHLARGESFSYVFSQPGTYRYFCRPHHGLGMKGVVVVTNR
ncbi:MAG: plastocyanin/azurin family copper-binding protein [candidate division WOR-3 bacterium]|nr:plastocyanin/azurin family copper-binding protein [candidate division WOR-3 bacterium]